MNRLAGFARVFPIGRPRYLVLRGRQRWLLGKRDGAIRSWREALAQAERLLMPYETGLAHAALGANLDPADPERTEHIEAARDILTRLGAAPALANFERTLAVPTGAQGG
jgi:hypothetical protein